MRRIFITILWTTLIVIGIILLIPYAILDVTIDKIDDWLQNVERGILRDQPNKIDNGEEQNGRNTEL